MKKLLTLVLIMCVVLGYSQASSKINNAQNFTQIVPNPFNIAGANSIPDGQWQLYKKDDLRWETYNINGLSSYVQSFVNFPGLTGKPSTLLGYGIIDAYPLLGNPSGFLTSFTEVDPTVPNYSKSLSGFSIIKLSTDPLYYPLSSNPAGYLTSAPAQVNADWDSNSGVTQILHKPIIYSFTGTTGQYTRGNGTYATFPTTVSAFANDSGYLTGINSSQINTALGYTPYNGTTNPNGYLSGITSGQVITALGYTPTPNTRTLTINGVSQDLSTNRTWTVGDVTTTALNTALSNYVTSSFLAITLTGYATTGGLAAGLSTKENTITTGTTAQYWRGDKSFQNLTSDVVTEGSNLYFTQPRARASQSAGTGISYNTTTGVITNSAPDQTVSITGAGGNTVTGTYPNFTITGTTPKRQITFTGTTDASGNYVITFSPAFSVAPNMQASISNQGINTSQVVKVVSSSTTGATLNVYQRNAVTLLGIEILLAATVPVSGATIDVLATEK